jgi:alcohol dehydrogenase
VRAVVYEGFEEPIAVAEVEDPRPAAHGVVIRVVATGLCRSDWHGWMGHDPDIVRFPHVPGHELAGTVEEVGRDVRSVRPGDRVTVSFICACGTCVECVQGEHQVCERQTQPGFAVWGSFAEYVAIDHADVNVVALPDELDFATAASLGCRFATAYRAVLQVGRLRAGEWLVVHGCGGVGLSAVMIGAAAGARVVGVDVNEEALALARDAGAEHAVLAGADVRELTEGGAHVSLDALGLEATCLASIDSLRRRGRHVQVGIMPSPPPVPMHRVMAHELQLLGTHGMAAHAYPQMLGLIAAGRLDPGRLITSRIGLDAAPAALAALGTSSPRGVTIIEPGQGL